MGKKRTFLLSLLFVFGSTLNAQITHPCLVFTDENRLPLVGVSIYSDDFSITGHTNNNGEFCIDSKQVTKSLNARLLGYKHVRIHPDSLKSNRSIILYPASTQLNEVIVVGRTNDSRKDLLAQIEVISSEEIDFFQAQSSADILESSPNVFVQKSQMGGGSPILRGFEANKVLLVVDGVRMNNTIYRSGHLQNSIGLDPLALERAEIILGPGALIYGSDAIGGVIHYRTRMPEVLSSGDSTHISLRNRLRWSSANNEKTVFSQVRVSGNKWASLYSFRYSDYSDLTSGSNHHFSDSNFGKRNFYVERKDGQDSIVRNLDPFRQISSAYHQYDIASKWLFQASKSWKLMANFQLSNTGNVPRYDQLNLIDQPGTPLFAEWDYGPQFRIMSSISATNDRPMKAR